MNLGEKIGFGKMETDRVMSELLASYAGLSKDLVEKRRKAVGLNILKVRKRDNFLVRFLRQFLNPLILVLLLATAIAFLAGEVLDGSIILLVLVFNGVVGAIMEGKADKTLALLESLEVEKVLVLREKKWRVLKSEELVPGDIVMLGQGDKVPADGRLITAQDLSVMEAALTGESVPVVKNIEWNGEDKSEYYNTMVYAGTGVVSGNGQFVVTATGEMTEMGQVALLASETDEEMPLMIKIKKLTKFILLFSILMIISVFVIGVLMSQDLSEMFLVGVALLVSVIPEGLPIILTLVLALGVKRMADNNVLVKRLPAVEALGAAEVIALDKTGTLTKNEMSVVSLYVHDKAYEVTGVGYEKTGDVLYDGEEVHPNEHVELKQLALWSTLSANAKIFRDKNGGVEVVGDPTEAAFLVFGEKMGFSKEVLLQKWPLLSEVPFSFRRKYYANAHQIGKENLMVVTGAPEVLIDMSTEVWTPGGGRRFSKNEKDEIREKSLEMQEKGLRVLALAIKEGVSDSISDRDVKSLRFVGILGMKDAMRAEVKESIKALNSAKIRTVMITGDIKGTAVSIADGSGIYKEGDLVMSGKEIEKMDILDLAQKIDKVSVFYRVSPVAKMKIVDAFKKKGKVTIMTGDGVNDAPSLRAAHIGVAMGVVGTAVAKESADIILLDDNIGMIPRATILGQAIFETIRRAVLFLFATNLSELLVVMGSLILVGPIPLTSVQIIWLNLVTDSFLVMALVIEKHRSSVEGKIRDLKSFSKIIDRDGVRRLVLMAITMVVPTLLVYRYNMLNGDPLLGPSIVLTLLVLFQAWNIFAVREGMKTIFNKKIWKRLILIAGALFVIALQVVAMYTPAIAGMLGLVPLSFVQWMMLLALSSLVLVADELYKWRRRVVDKRKEN